MSENVFVVRHGPTGAGLLKENGMIFVKFPKDCKCTCEKGKKVLEAITTMGGWTFSIPETGTWTIRIYDLKPDFYGNHRETTRTIEITSDDPVKMVEINFKLFLYDYNKDYMVDELGEWKGYREISEQGEMHVDGNGTSSGAFFYLVNPVSILGYEKLCFNVSRYTGPDAYGGHSYWSFCSSKPTKGYWYNEESEKYGTVTSTGIYEIPLDDLKGEEYYIRFGIREGNEVAGWKRMGIWSCWLE